MKVGIYILVKVDGDLGIDGFAFSDFTLVTNNTQRQTSLPQEPVFELLETDYIGKPSPSTLSRATKWLSCLPPGTSLHAQGIDFENPPTN